MIDNFLTVAQQVGILFVLMGFGAFLRRIRIITDAGAANLVNVLILTVTPCLIVDSFQRPFDSGKLKGLVLTFLIAVLTHLAIIALARVCVRTREDATQRTLRLAAVFSNAGFMGLPLEQALLGDEGVFFGVVYIVVFNLFMWSWGVNVMRNDDLSGYGRGLRFLKMAVNPGTVGLACGLPLFFFSVKLPPLLAAPIHQVSNLNTPLAMILIGYSLFGANLKRVVKIRAVYVAAVLRLLVCPLLVIAALYPFRRDLDRNLMLAVVTAASAPVAAMVSMFAAKFRRDEDTGVAMVSGTTLLSLLTMPVVIALALQVL